MRQRISKPFGRPSPAFTEREAMGDLLKLIRENVAHKYEVGYAVRARDCSGRTRVEMLDGQGGADLGLANACDTGTVVGSGGVAEIWWAQRSGGRTVRLLFDRGVRSGRSTIVRKTYPVSREMPVATPVAKIRIAVGTESFGDSPVMRSTDDGETWSPVLSDQFPSAPRAAAYGAATFVIGGDEPNHVAYSTDGGETWTGVALPNWSAHPVYSIAWNGTSFVAVGNNQQAGYVGISTSTNGVNWTTIPTSAATGFTTGETILRVTAHGNNFIGSGSSGLAGWMYYSADGGATWRAFVIPSAEAEGTPPGAAYDLGRGGFWTLLSVPDQGLSTGPNGALASNGSDIVGVGAHSTEPYPTPHYPLFYGNHFDTVPDPLGGSGDSGVFVSTAGAADMVEEAQDVLGDSTALQARSIIWDGTQFIAVAHDFYSSHGTYGTSTAWLATSADGKTWTAALEAESPGLALEKVYSFAHVDGRYFAGGDGVAPDYSPLSYADDPTGTWTAATVATGCPYRVLAIAGEE